METAKKLPGPNVYIEATVCGGKCRIAGMRISCLRIRTSADDAVEAHPHFSLGQIHATLAYYYDYRHEIRREWREAEELTSSLRDRYPSRLGRAGGPA